MGGIKINRGLLNPFCKHTGNKNVSIVHRCPTRTISFYVQWTVKLG